MKEIINDRVLDRRNILAMTSQSPGPGTARKSFFMIRKVQPNRKELGAIERATPGRVRDKRAGVDTNIGDIILAVNRRINKGFNFDQYWAILDSGAQTSLFHNAKLLKNLCEKTHNTQIVGISDEVLEVTHEGHFCDNLRVDWHPDVPVNVVSFSQAAALGWGMTYDEAMHDFIVRTHAGQKLVFSLCEGLYICDMTSQVYRNLRARCDDGVELFVGSYKETVRVVLTLTLTHPIKTPTIGSYKPDWTTSTHTLALWWKQQQHILR